MASHRKHIVARKIKSWGHGWTGTMVVGFLGTRGVHFSCTIEEGPKAIIGRKVTIEMTPDEAEKLGNNLVSLAKEVREREALDLERHPVREKPE